MKFKKVEIQAFRAYSKVEDGTFDFEIDPNTWADFVSIYAPNGFGKTSFYDAVEWGYTRNIHRFLRKQKFNQEVAKSEKNLNAQEQQFILKNRNATHLDGYVKLYTTQSDQPIESKIPNPRKGSGDYKFNDKETVHSYFQAVILSQEWIDAFLKEDNASDRYRTFMDYFGDKELDQYYRCLVSLYNANETNIAQLLNQLKGIQLELAFEGDLQILAKVNEQVQLINILGGELPHIDGNVGESELHHFSATLLEKINECQFALQRNKEKVSFIETAFIGDVATDGIDAYYDAVQRLQTIKEREKDLEELLLTFKEREKQQQAIADLEQRIKTAVFGKESLQRILVLFPVYEQVQKQIEEGQKALTALQASLPGEEALLGKCKSAAAALVEKLQRERKKMHDADTKIKALPQLLEKQKTRAAKRTELEQTNQALNEQLLTKETLVKQIEKEKAEIANALVLLRKGDWKEVFLTFWGLQDNNFQALQQTEDAARQARQKISELTQLADQQKVFISELQQFIAKGTEIINASQASACPLCEQDYGSYTALASKLAGHRVFSTQQQLLLAQRTEQLQLLATWEQDKKRMLSSYIEVLVQRGSLVDTGLQQAKNESAISRSQLARLKEELEAIADAEAELNAVFRGKDHDTYLKELQVELEATEKAVAQLSEQQAQLVSEVAEKEIQLTQLKGAVEELKEKLAAYRSNAMYTKVLSYHQHHFAIQPLTLAFYKQQVTARVVELEGYKQEFETCRKQLAATTERVGTHNLPATEKDKELVLKTKEASQRVLASFEQFIQSKLGLTVAGLERQQLEQQLNERRISSTTAIRKHNKQLEHYTLLQQLVQNVQPYLKYEKARQNGIEIRKRLHLLEHKVRPEIETEKKKVASFLEEKIQSFFYEDLINTIYRKIDPHPEYTHIKFQCDFSEDKPQLNVCVTNQAKDHYLIPNLYFSTAQLNILSLSIFLAKALNATDEKGNPIDCIFIDDPIQSMDSINVLSTIDLLRSIVVNQQKQIILSTHDENFHQLLQKKLSPKHFKSKFIELETFGKVRREKPKEAGS